MNVNTVWITVNRECNLRCEWCYAKGVDYHKHDEMSLGFAMDLLDLSKKAGVSNAIILGGEPTLWNSLPEFIRQINQSAPEVLPTIVTNGILFSNRSFRKKFSGLDYKVGLSLKAGNETQFAQLTGGKTFSRVKESIMILTQEGLLSGTSITINNRILENLEELASVVADSGGTSISFEMCVPSFDSNGEPSGEYVVHPKDLALRIFESYPVVDRIMNGRVYYQMGLPFCLFPASFIENLKKRGQLISGCHVFRRDGIVFDTKGAVLLCNCLYHVPIGLWKQDFDDIHSFREWWDREEVSGFNSRLLNYPIDHCSDCDDYDHCGGGCCLHWFYFNPAQILTKGGKCDETGLQAAR